MQKHTSNTRLFREPGSQYDMCDSTSLLDAFCDMVLGGADKRLAPMTISEDGATLILELNAVMRWLSVSIIMFAYNLSKSSTKGVLQYRNGWILALVTMTLARTKAITEIAGWNEREERLDMVFFFFCTQTTYCLLVTVPVSSVRRTSPTKSLCVSCH